jgi:malonate-semialdehyde dehydrogenase (acetylating) / methylmalonate-semialdehyde dehydrogenase
MLTGRRRERLGTQSSRESMVETKTQERPVTGLARHFINGALTEGSGGRRLPVHDPALGRANGEVLLADEATTRAAVEAAKRALPGWAARTPLSRARIMFRFKALIEQNFETIAKVISSEHGKVFEDACGELTRGLEVVEFACGIPHVLKGEHSLNVGTNVDSHSMMQPVGICAGITPFNFPAMVPMWMYPVAIACGNTFVLKPSEKDPAPRCCWPRYSRRPGCQMASSTSCKVTVRPSSAC